MADARYLANAALTSATENGLLGKAPNLMNYSLLLGASN